MGLIFPLQYVLSNWDSLSVKDRKKTVRHQKMLASTILKKLSEMQKWWYKHHK